MADEKLVTVYTLSNPLEAEIVKNALEDEGIRCYLEDMNQAAVPGLIGLQIRVQVAGEDEERARAFFKEHDERMAAEAEKEAQEKEED